MGPDIPSTTRVICFKLCVTIFSLQFAVYKHTYIHMDIVVFCLSTREIRLLVCYEKRVKLVGTRSRAHAISHGVTFCLSVQLLASAFSCSFVRPSGRVIHVKRQHPTNALNLTKMLP